jgi:osmotically-inducible protein OsmY
MKTPRSSWLMLIAAVVLTASCSHMDVGITTKIRAKMAVDESVRPYTIEVATHDGVVSLTGRVGSDREREQAIELARETSGVKDVQANLIPGKG